MSKTFGSRTRLRFLLVVVVVIFAVIFARLIYLHVWKQEKLIGIIERNRQKFDVIHSCRGNVVDKRGNLLATTRSVIELGVDPQMIREEDRDKWQDLARLTKLNIKDIERVFTEKFRKVRDGDGFEEVKQIRWHRLVADMEEGIYEKVVKLNIKGVYGNRKYERIYPQRSLAAHVIGFVNKEGSAVTGVEHSMDFYLNGQDGWRETERDGHRRELAQFRTREVDSENGLNVELTIDIMVQHAIEQEIARFVKEYTPKAATIIVSEPITGYILGLANYPSFDPNEFWKYDVGVHKNRAVTDVYEPGSPFKAVTASSVLNESLMNLTEQYDCSMDRISYQGRIVRLPKDHRPFHILSGRDVIKKSSNRGVAQMAMKLDNEKYYEYIKLFGFGEKTGFGYGEVTGKVHRVKDWDGLTISRLPMGHAIDCTPMQMHCAMSVIATGGVLMQPQIVKRIFNETGETIVDFAPRAKRRVISEETAELMAEVLSEVVGPEGTSKQAFICGYNVAGKSGTSQKIIRGRYSNQHHISSFSGFFPADNPRLQITVIIDEAKIGRCAYGGVVAAPVSCNIGESLIQCLNIQPSDVTTNLVACKH